MSHNVKKFVAFQVDPLHTLNPKTDTSLLLAKEAQHRGFRLFAYTPDALSLNTSSVFAYGSFFEVDDQNNAVNIQAPESLALASADFVLVRQNPPYDMGYIGCLEILATLPKTTRVLNCSKALRLYSEKTIPLLFPHLIPKTVITRSQAVIADFLSAQSQIVLKPLYGFGGMDVFLIRSDDVNRDALIDMMCSRYPHGVIAQEFIPNVSHNERRLIMINGQLKAVFKRIPEVGSIRSNTAVGGTATACVITADDEKIAETLSPFLRENEIMLCGVDAIDDKLIEVNITSPTGLLYANSLYGMHLEVDFWNAALAQ